MKALLRINWLNLLRDRVALVLTFLLPIAFFTIFAMIFGGMGNAGPSESRPLKILAVDLDDSIVSRRLVESLDEQAGLEVATSLPDAEDRGLSRGLSPGQAPDREAAARAVRAGRFSAALVIPAGFGATFPAFGGDALAIELIYDPSNPVAEFAVGGMLQAAAFTAAPDILFERGIEALEDFGGGPLTPAQREAVDDLKQLLADGFPAAGGSDAAGDEAGSGAANAAFGGLVAVDSVNVRSLGAPEDAPRRNSMIAYYAAGMGVMFLLFSMTGAAGSILEEEESGALERLLMSRTSLTTILAAKWLFFALLGFVQVSVMFVYGNLAFGLPLWTANYLVGFVVVASVTALSASAFGLLLASLCRSRSQLSGLSTIIILIMSAVGGSMVPRFVMPAAMETLGRFTFNGWALDAFLGVFWHDDPDAGVLQSLAPVLLPVAVMLGMMAAFLAGARLAARRWETV